MSKQEIYLIAESFSNAGFNATQKEFLQQIRLMHLTSQQIFAGLILMWLQNFVACPVDDRNKYSVVYIIELLEAFARKFLDEPLQSELPLI
ncbi:MAG: hypothetical protein LBT43_08905 [Prevotella sp.]|jgi:hypothetical protein|nr:hypothetical protein [Prevotella sp.]